MRVALVVPGGVDRSGRERVIPALLWLLERLARRHAVVVFALAQEPAPSRYSLLGATVVNLGVTARRVPGERLVTALLRLERALDAEGPFDVVHAFFGDTPGLLATLAARRRGLPCLVSLCGGELTARPEIGYGSMLRPSSRLQVLLALRLATRVTVASRLMRQALEGLGFTADEVPLGVPASLLREPSTVRVRAPFRLLAIGSLNRVKDHATLLRAFRRVVGDVHLSIAGEDALGGDVQRLAHTLGLADRVSFLGFRPADEIPSLIDDADLLVVSSRHEAGCVAVLEAAARGVPTVGTAVGHVLELSPQAAVAVPVGDDAALASEVLGLLDDPARRARLGGAARAFARANDADATSRSFETLYAEVAGARRPGSTR